jgi:hypothetical protein
MNYKDLSKEQLEAEQASVGREQLALRAMALAISDELDFRAQLAAIEKATGRAVGDAMAQTLRAAREAEKLESEQMRLAAKTAAKVRARAMSAAWEEARAAARTAGETLDKEAWERGYLEAHA